jgi:hypothetical protein
MMKKVTIRSATFPSCYLRIDGTGVTSFTDPGSGIVNCQSFASEWETLMIENDPGAETFSIRSTGFEDVYLRLDAEGFTQAAASGGGVVNCQYTAQSYEKFRFSPQRDGTKAIASVKYPDVYLRMDGTTGVVNCQVCHHGVGPWEKFIVSEFNQGLAREELEEAIAKYGPILQLHPDEEYDNCSVEWFLEHASLYDNEADVTIVHPTAEQLPQGDVEEGRYWLTLEKDAKGGDWSTSKAYVRAYWTQGMTYTDIQFWFFSAYNGPGRAHVNGLLFDWVVNTGDPDLAPLGEHVGDWEYIVTRVDNKDKSLLAVIISQHGDGIVFEEDQIADSLEMVDGTHPVIYSSLNGHANYAKVGTNYSEYVKHPKGGIPAGIEFSLHNTTQKGGKSLDSSKYYQVISADWLEGRDAYVQPAWVKYPGRWGPEGTSTHIGLNAVVKIVLASAGWLGKFAWAIGLLAASILPYFVKDDINGPSAPMRGGPWNGNY